MHIANYEAQTICRSSLGQGPPYGHIVHAACTATARQVTLDFFSLQKSYHKSRRAPLPRQRSEAGSSEAQVTWCTVYPSLLGSYLLDHCDLIVFNTTT